MNRNKHIEIYQPSFLPDDWVLVTFFHNQKPVGECVCNDHQLPKICLEWTQEGITPKATAYGVTSARTIAA